LLVKVLPDYSFPRTAKLIKTDDFSSVFNFRKRISGHYLAIHYQYNLLDRPRLGLIVSKKNARLSVTRNYMRRVLRELFRTQQERLTGLDMVVRTQHMFDRSHYALVKHEFHRLVAKLPNDNG
jgi:ribonuclease P protein component